ncbi:hypothetical protein WK66_05715 [Burkholderia ubonensis]|nr:hypothetical protein WK66_05715 [Burkholderia ubonensis]
MMQPVESPTRPHIAIVDGYSDRQSTVVRWLSEAGAVCELYDSIESLIENHWDRWSDIAILGAESVTEDVIAVIGKLARYRHRIATPVLVLGKAEVGIEVAMLDAGADGYVRWPIRQETLSARIGALLRRAYGMHTHALREAYGSYVFDIRLRRVLMDGQAVELAPKELQIALALFRNRAGYVSLQQIWNLAWGRDAEDEALKRTVTVHISRIRRKLELSGAWGWRLVFSSDHGYRLIESGSTEHR